MRLRRLWPRLFSGVAAVLLAAALLAPYLWAEYEFDLHGQTPVAQVKTAAPLTGRWADDYFVVETLDAATFAIGEPLYYQGNYSYLILGSKRAVLFDAGSGLRDIVPLVRSLTRLPVTVIASHLHFDHVGALGRFERTAVLDDPSLRARVHGAQLTLERYEYLGFADRRGARTFPVDEWWPAGSAVDLGGRVLQVLSTPGHTPTSVSLYDAQRRQLFAGDFIYPGNLYAFLPGASRSAYLATTRALIAAVDPATQIFAGHMADSTVAVKAPVLEVADLQALELTLTGISDGHLASTGFYPRVFPVRGAVKFATGWPWNNR